MIQKLPGIQRLINLKRRRRLFLKTLFLLGFLLAQSSCTWFQSDSSLSSAQKDADAGQYAQAVFKTEKLVKSHPESKEALEAARLGAKITFLETKDYEKALFYYRHLVLYSPDEAERLESQKKLAEIYFERLSDHGQAVNELNKLLQLQHKPDEELKFRMNLAKANFYLSRFQQAEAEADLVLEKKLTPEMKFDVQLLKGNIFFSTKQLDKAITIFKEIMESFPEKSRDEHVGVSLAICYEEKNDFTAAREVLNRIKPSYPNPEFIDTKLARLEQRQNQLPGAKGLKK
jgi:tetratricopeptide (TPR) repeat protein